MDSKDQTSRPAGGQAVKLRYEETRALFSGQFVTSVSSDEVLINFSSGTITDPDSGETVLPIHTRIAMSRDGAKRLLTVLKQSLETPGVGGAMARTAVKSRGARQGEADSPSSGFPRIVDRS